VLFDDLLDFFHNMFRITVVRQGLLSNKCVTMANSLDVFTRQVDYSFVLPRRGWSAACI